MARPRIYKTEGVVLRQMPLGEADRLLTMFSPDLGKLRVVARGVRRAKSKLAGHTEQLTRVRISVAVGRNLDALSEAETIDSFRRLKEDLGHVSQALYLAELVDGFTVEQSPNPGAYRLLLDALSALDADRPTGFLLRHFELGLLRRSGFGPELRQCVACGRGLEPEDHMLTCAGGGALCRECRPTATDPLLRVSLPNMKLLRFLQRASLDQALELTASRELSAESERVMSAYVRHVLERETKSAAFLKLVASGG